jgi:HTH-type transcriptional regulator/antitoxin HigA
MDPRIIKNDKQHKLAMAELARLMNEDPAAGTPEGDRLELFAMLIENYEKQRYPFARPDPLDAIRFRMEERGLRQKDLAPMLGGANRVSEVLSGKRSLTLAMVRAIHRVLDIPAELLVQEPRATYAVARRRQAG